MAFANIIFIGSLPRYSRTPKFCINYNKQVPKVWDDDYIIIYAGTTTLQLLRVRLVKSKSCISYNKTDYSKNSHAEK